MPSVTPWARLKWPFGGSWYGYAPWNSLLLDLLELPSLVGLLGEHASRDPMPATPTPAIPNSWSTCRREIALDRGLTPGPLLPESLVPVGLILRPFLSDRTPMWVRHYWFD